MKEAATRRWTHAEKHRYYQATVQPDLFGGWVVMRFWGQLGSQLGGQLFEPVENEPAGERALGRIALVRARRGYRPAPAPSPADCTMHSERATAAAPSTTASHG